MTKNLLTLGGSSNSFNLSTAVSPTSGGTVTKSPNNTSFDPNASVQLTATPNSGWTFVGWSGDATGSTNPLTVTMSSNLNVTALFALVSGDDTTNLIKDGNFPSSSVVSANDGVSWKLGQWGNSAATASVSNGTAAIDVTTIGTQSYQPQLVQYGLALEENFTYKLTFTARAAMSRKIEVTFQQATDPWASYAAAEFDLTPTDQNYELVFTMANTTDPAAQFAFNLGQTTGNVYLSNVKLVYTTDSPTAVNLNSQNGMATRGSIALVSINDRTLWVAPVEGSLQVRVVDVNGKVKAEFNAVNATVFSLANFPTGRYFVETEGAGVRQSVAIILE